MNKSKRSPCRWLLAAVAAFAAYCAHSAAVSIDGAKSAATAFLSGRMASAALPGRSVAAMERRGNLWVARLAPSGYVILSGSDFCTPIISFSEKDFTEPGEGSAFFVLLSGADESCADAEANGGSGEADGDRALWARLASGRTHASTMNTASVEDKSVTVKPFLATHWQQWQPYNDFAPVVHQDIAAGGYRTYRGRSQAGCVATATAQIFNWFKWPARVDAVRTVSHTVSAGSSTPKTPFAIRFDGHEPLTYTNLLSEYLYQLGDDSTDLRGTLDESVRFPMARLMLFCDSLANMTFGGSGIGGTQGSSSYFPGVMDNSASWYRKGTSFYVYDATLLQTAIDRSKSCIQSGIPVCITIPGHQVVGDGWAEENGTSYMHVNYGFGGANDGYYAMKADTTSTIQYVFVDYKPKKMVQLDPLPAVSGESVTLSWHFPDCFTNEVKSFSITAASSSSVTETFTDDFPSGEAGEFYGEFANTQGVWVYSRNEKGESTDYVIKCYAGGTGTYTWTNTTWSISSRSRIRFPLTSSNASGQTLEVQANIDGTGWQTIETPILESGGEKTNDIDIDLSQYAGKLATFRLAFSGRLDWSISDPVIVIDDVKFTNVARASVSTVSASATARSHALAGLAEGNYTFTVTPVFEKESGESASGSTRVSASAPPLPQILSVSSKTPAFKEGFFRECAIGTNYFTVACSGNVTSLEAFASHTDYLPDSAIEVEGLGEGQYVVKFDASAIPQAADRTRMIMTLKATDANGTSVYKDLSLRFSAETAQQIYGAPEEDHEITLDGIPLSYLWIKECDPSIASDESALEAYRKTAHNGISYWENYALGIEPTNTVAKLRCGAITIKDGKITVESDTSAFSLREGLKFNITLEHANSPSAPDGDWKEVGGMTDNPGTGVASRFYRIKATIQKD